MEIGRHEIERAAEITVLIAAVRELIALVPSGESGALQGRISAAAEAALSRPGIWGPGKDRASRTISELFTPETPLSGPA